MPEIPERAELDDGDARSSQAAHAAADLDAVAAAFEDHMEALYEAGFLDVTDVDSGDADA